MEHFTDLWFADQFFFTISELKTSTFSPYKCGISCTDSNLYITTNSFKKRTFSIIWDKGVQYFEEICRIAIFGFIIKIGGFVILTDTHKKFADLR